MDARSSPGTAPRAPSLRPSPTPSHSPLTSPLCAGRRHTPSRRCMQRARQGGQAAARGGGGRRRQGRGEWGVALAVNSLEGAKGPQSNSAPSRSSEWTTFTLTHVSQSIIHSLKGSVSHSLTCSISHSPTRSPPHTYSFSLSRPLPVLLTQSHNLTRPFSHIPALDLLLTVCFPLDESRLVVRLTYPRLPTHCWSNSSSNIPLCNHTE